MLISDQVMIITSKITACEISQFFITDYVINVNFLICQFGNSESNMSNQFKFSSLNALILITKIPGN